MFRGKETTKAGSVTFLKFSAYTDLLKLIRTCLAWAVCKTALRKDVQMMLPVDILTILPDFISTTQLLFLPQKAGALLRAGS